jgi:hypothetical protein
VHLALLSHCSIDFHAADSERHLETQLKLVMASLWLLRSPEEQPLLAMRWLKLPGCPFQILRRLPRLSPRHCPLRHFPLHHSPLQAGSLQWPPL